MRVFSIIAMGAVLGGCAHEERIERDISRLSSKSCADLALQRTEDAKLNGYDFGLQTRIFDDSYANCIRWDAAHRIN